MRGMGAVIIASIRNNLRSRILPKIVICLMLRARALSYSIDNLVGQGPCPAHFHDSLVGPRPWGIAMKIPFPSSVVPMAIGMVDCSGLRLTAMTGKIVQ
jgi:hypothetical protein